MARVSMHSTTGENRCTRCFNFEMECDMIDIIFFGCDACDDCLVCVEWAALTL